MSVIFSGNKLSPAPLPTLTVNKPPERDGKPTATTKTLVLRGKLISHRGSPRSDGSWWTLSGDAPDENIDPDSNHTALMTKRAALEALLSQQNQILELQPWDGAAPTKYVARLRELVYPEGIVYNYCDYQATFDVDEQGVANPGVDSLSETWSVEIADDDKGVYKVRHTVSVKGRTERDATGTTTKSAWESAKDYALNTIGLGFDAGMAAASGVLNLSGLGGYNHQRTQQVDEIEGSVQISEEWTCKVGTPAIHDQTTAIRIDANRARTVSVEGSITGLRSSNAVLTVTQTKQAAMEAEWALVEPTLYAAATGVAGQVLNTNPLSSRVQRNNSQGVLSYGVEWSNRPSAFAGTISEKVTLTETTPGDAYATIPIPGRAAGPLPQSLGTKTGLSRRNLTIELVTEAATMTTTPTMPSTTAFVATQAPSATYVFLDEDTVSWDPYEGRYSRATSWSFGG